MYHETNISKGNKGLLEPVCAACNYSLDIFIAFFLLGPAFVLLVRRAKYGIVLKIASCFSDNSNIYTMLLSNVKGLHTRRQSQPVPCCKLFKGLSQGLVQGTCPFVCTCRTHNYEMERLLIQSVTIIILYMWQIKLSLIPNRMKKFIVMVVSFPSC